MHNYNRTFYNSNDLKIEAKKYLEVLPKNIVHLISMGASGCSIASAMIALSDRPLFHCHLRKDDEKAHSSIYAGYGLHSRSKVVIVDDFINSGTTIKAIINKLTKRPINLNKKQIKIIIVDECDMLFRDIAKGIKIKCVGRKRKINK